MWRRRRRRRRLDYFLYAKFYKRRSSTEIPEEGRSGGGEDPLPVGHADPPGPEEDLPGSR